MNEQKKGNGLLKENEQMNRKPTVLSDEMLQQVSGGKKVREMGVCRHKYDAFCGKADPCIVCPYVNHS